MKNLITRSTLLIAAAMTIGFTQAAEPVRTTTLAKRTALERTLDRALSKHLSYPLGAKEDMTGEVYVSFVVDREGDLEVLECRSTNEALKDYVLGKLAKVNVGENPDGIWRKSHFRIAFRPEKVTT